MEQTPPTGPANNNDDAKARAFKERVAANRLKSAKVKVDPFDPSKYQRSSILAAFLMRTAPNQKAFLHFAGSFEASHDMKRFVSALIPYLSYGIDIKGFDEAEVDKLKSYDSNDLLKYLTDERQEMVYITPFSLFNEFVGSPYVKVLPGTQTTMRFMVNTQVQEIAFGPVESVYKAMYDLFLKVAYVSAKRSYDFFDYDPEVMRLARFAAARLTLSGQPKFTMLIKEGVRSPPDANHELASREEEFQGVMEDIFRELMVRGIIVDVSANKRNVNLCYVLLSKLKNMEPILFQAIIDFFVEVDAQCDPVSLSIDVEGVRHALLEVQKNIEDNEFKKFKNNSGLYNYWDSEYGAKTVELTRSLVMPTPVLPFGKRVGAVMHFAYFIGTFLDSSIGRLGTHYNRMVLFGSGADMFAHCSNLLANNGVLKTTKRVVMPDGSSIRETLPVGKYVGMEGSMVMHDHVDKVPFDPFNILWIEGCDIKGPVLYYISSFPPGSKGEPLENLLTSLTHIASLHRSMRQPFVAFYEYTLAAFGALKMIFDKCVTLQIGLEVKQSPIVTSDHVVFVFGQVNNPMTLLDLWGWKIGVNRTLLDSNRALRESVAYGANPRFTGRDAANNAFQSALTYAFAVAQHFKNAAKMTKAARAASMSGVADALQDFEGPSLRQAPRMGSVYEQAPPAQPTRDEPSPSVSNLVPVSKGKGPPKETDAETKKRKSAGKDEEEGKK